MRRSVVLFVVAALLLSLGLWWASRPPERPARAGVPRVAVKGAPPPKPVRTETVAEPTEGQPFAALPDEEVAILRCGALTEDRHVAARKSNGDARVVSVDTGDLRLTPGTWFVEYGNSAIAEVVGTLTVRAGEILPCDLSDRPVHGVVRTPSGSPVPGAEIRGDRCRGARAEADGAFVVEAVPVGCTLTAWHRDGLLGRPGTSVQITPWLQGDVALQVDATPVAGLGIGIAPHADGVRVRAVFPGTPAEAAGLRAGDVIVGVDGETVGGDDVGRAAALDAFIRAATGPEGTTARLEVLRGEAVTEVTVRRERLSARDAD